MTVCFFGDYPPDYARNQVLIKGLKKNRVKVLQCNDCSSGIKRYLKLIKAHRPLRGQYDVLWVGYSNSRLMVLLAKILTRQPVVWDAFYSLYDNWIFDRKFASPYSLKAFYYWFLDWFGSYLADIVVLDTLANIKYFIKTFHISPKKFWPVLVGTDEEIIYPRQKIKKDEDFIVHFHGWYIPVQGTANIIKAAKILEKEDIRFNLVGRGQEFKKVKKLADELGLPNVRFFPPVSYEELTDFMAQADVCLGLLGDVPRVVRAIPNKVYEAAAMRRAIINADTPAIRELFRDRESILLCQKGNPKDLAKKILELKNNPELKDKIAQNAYEIFQKKARPEIIGAALKRKLAELVAEGKV